MSFLGPILILNVADQRGVCEKNDTFVKGFFEGEHQYEKEFNKRLLFCPGRRKAELEAVVLPGKQI